MAGVMRGPGEERDGVARPDAPEASASPESRARERARAPRSGVDGVPATNPFGITVPVPLVSDRELGISRPGAHSADAPPRVGAVLAGTVAAPPPHRRTVSPGIAIALWSGVAVLLLVALASTIGALNRDVYSAHGFVRNYLSALESRDADVALAFPGVRIPTTELQQRGLPSDAASTLLRNSVIKPPTDIRLESDTETAPGHHTVVYSGMLAGKRQNFSFEVEHTGRFALVFDSWRFATSPVGALTVTVLHDTGFTINGLALDPRAHPAAGTSPGFNNTADYLVLTPGQFDLTRDTELLRAEPVTTAVPSAGIVPVSLDVRPTASFVGEVQSQINHFLDDCATQTVLQPTGCPFGTVIDDRILGDPAWSIAAYPAVSVGADDTAFQVPETPGTAHIKVEVKSLFDGEQSVVDRDEPFTIGASITISGDGTLNIQLH